MSRRKIYLLKYIWVFIGIILGAIGGFLYWNYIGCESGQCAITSVWYRSTLYGSIMGGLLGSTINVTENKVKKEERDHHEL